MVEIFKLSTIEKNSYRSLSYKKIHTRKNERKDILAY